MMRFTVPLIRQTFNGSYTLCVCMQIPRKLQPIIIEIYCVISIAIQIKRKWVDDNTRELNDHYFVVVLICNDDNNKLSTIHSCGASSQCAISYCYAYVALMIEALRLWYCTFVAQKWSRIAINATFTHLCVWLAAPPKHAKMDNFLLTYCTLGHNRIKRNNDRKRSPTQILIQYLMPLNIHM